ncbi:MAG: M61 family metallopeptidase [Gammaproteobacteria bacterium]
MNNAIHYSIVPIDPAAHLFRVSCTVPNPDPAGQRFSLPAWIPGSYMIREFAKNIVELWAESGGNIVACEKIDKATWQCEPVAGPLVITCDVYAWDLSVRAAHLDDTHGYFNGTSVFLAVQGHEHLPCRVRIERPAGDAYAGWRLATSLRTAPDTECWQFGDYEAADYDELIDHPVEMGHFTQARFVACSVPHDVVITGIHRCDMARLCADLQKICETQVRLFGEPAPMDRYVFLVQVVGEGYGGLEHRASTSLLASRDDLPLVTDDPSSMKDGYRQFLGLCSHEYFHTWNVKRIKPQAFQPYDLSRENYTRQLWAFEGFTSYYDDLLLVRAGVISPASWLDLLGQNITRVLRAPGRLKQSVAESSFDAWTKFYRQDENSPNAIVSYYAKGALVALALDLALRRETGGTRSLDHLMRELWQRHGLPAHGVPEDAIGMLLVELGGESLRALFDDAVHGTDDLPLAELLATMDIDLCLRAAEGATDNGGKPGAKGGKVRRPRPSLGIRTAGDGLGARIQHCFEGAPAMAAGLSAGDVIVAVGGLRATHANIEKLLAGWAVGDAVTLHAFRRDELRECRVTLGEAPADTCYLQFRGGEPSAAAQAWLCGKAANISG